MGKFKVGDRVRSLDIGYSVYEKIGTITAVRPNDKGYDVKFDGVSVPLVHYPHEIEAEFPEPVISGITLRDQFAIAALTSLAREAAYTDSGIKRACQIAYGFADAMLAERDRTTHSAKEEKP